MHVAQSDLYGRREDGLIFWTIRPGRAINNVFWWTLPIATGSSTNHKIKLYVEWLKYKNSLFSYFTKVLCLKGETEKRRDLCDYLCYCSLEIQAPRLHPRPSDSESALVTRSWGNSYRAWSLGNTSLIRPLHIINAAMNTFKSLAVK